MVMPQATGCCEVAARLRRQMRGADLLGRLNWRGVCAVAARDRSGLERWLRPSYWQALRREPMAIAGTVTASFGVAVGRTGANRLPTGCTVPIWRCARPGGAAATR